MHRLEKVYKPSVFRRPVQALRGLDLDVRAGETYGFLGLNGAGKTTTFKLLLGLLRPTGGEGWLFGRPLGDRRALARLGFLPELPAYYPYLSGGEVLRLARDLSGAKRDDARDKRLLDELGIGFAWSRPTRRLSKGQLQRVGLAQALVHEPELLILDEPMSGLDPLARGLVKDRLRAEREAGRTIVLSTHVLADVEALSDRIGLVSEGRLLRSGRTEELLSGSVREVRIEGSGAINEDVLAGMPNESLLVPGEPWRVLLQRPEPFQVDACLRRIIQQGGTVLGVESRREDLEAVFVRTMENAGQGEDDRCAS
ncbi:MAG: ABC transporter ATP-binding protein [Candidatus Eisenbacteria bacterium]